MNDQRDEVLDELRDELRIEPSAGFATRVRIAADASGRSRPAYVWVSVAATAAVVVTTMFVLRYDASPGEVTVRVVETGAGEGPVIRRTEERGGGSGAPEPASPVRRRAPREDTDARPAAIQPVEIIVDPRARIALNEMIARVARGAVIPPETQTSVEAAPVEVSLLPELDPIEIVPIAMNEIPEEVRQ